MKNSSKEAAKVKKRALSNLQRVHDSAAFERRTTTTNDLILGRKKRFEGIESAQVNCVWNQIEQEEIWPLMAWACVGPNEGWVGCTECYN